jgi:hypothetical protein
MAAENITITTYRLAKDSTTGKKIYNGTPTLVGVSVHIQLERLDKAADIDQANRFRTYRMFSEDNLDLKSSDKVVDAMGGEYKVHTVQKELSYNGAGYNTIAFLTKADDV